MEKKIIYDPSKNKTLNKIQQFFQNLTDSREDKENRTMNFSTQIEGMIGMTPNQMDRMQPYIFGKWKILHETRAFSKGWVDIFEVLPIEYGDSVGYCNTHNPPWVETGGTKSINLMPSDMRDEFINDLKKHLQE